MTGTPITLPHSRSSTWDVYHLPLQLFVYLVLQFYFCCECASCTLKPWHGYEVSTLENIHVSGSHGK